MANVRDFGAVGDGRADDTEAIQHAIKDGDGFIEFDRGEFCLNRTIEIDLSKVRRIGIHGSAGTAKILMKGEGPAFFLKATHASTADPAGFRESEWMNERMPQIRDLEIEGQHPNADGIRIEGVMQPILSGLLIREVRHAVHITNRARNVLIDQCQIYHNRGVGVFLDQVNLHQTIISSSHISYCRMGGIRIVNSEIRNLQITGNDIEYNNKKSHQGLADTEKIPDDTAEILIDVGSKGSIREGTIASNTIQATYNDKGANIRMIGSSEEDPRSNHRAGMWSISGNLIGSQKTNVHLTSVRGVTLTGNYIYSGHHRNILVEKSRNIVIGDNCLGHNPDYKKNELATGVRIEDCDNCTINGLLVEDAEAGKHTVPNSVQISRDALLELSHCRRVVVSGSQILDPTPVGILVDSCRDTLINGCMILDDREPPRMESAVVWKGNEPGNAISNCRIGKGKKGRIVADAAVRQHENH